MTQQIVSPLQDCWSFLVQVPYLGLQKSSPQSHALPQRLSTMPAKLAWLRTLFHELRLFLPHIPILWCDNNSTIALASNPVFHSRTKHIEVDYHYVRACALRRDLGVKFISGHDNFVDIFTKPLPGPSFLFLRGKLLANSTSSLRGDVKRVQHSVQITEQSQSTKQ